uniref:Uncharacterized protein n=1 Tax=Globisporangium ultimum (strain ATCC 200006 / CBS 805.95 / DAOM BR144) TaxID=431595 RepID=K3XAV3_GLOUD
MPFADYQDMLERKTQWFHRNVKAAVRTSASQRHRPFEPQYPGRTRSDSSACSNGSESSRDESSGDNESDEDGDAEWSSDDENNAPSPPSSFIARERDSVNCTHLKEAPVDIPPTAGTRATAIRDAFTQATLKCDQSQQTSIGNHGSLAPSPQRGPSRTVTIAKESVVSITAVVLREISWLCVLAFFGVMLISIEECSVLKTKSPK